MLPFLSHPTHSYIEVKTLYNGKAVGKDFFNKHPEIESKYPSQQDFNNCYMTVLSQVEKTRKIHKINISENGIEVTVKDNI